MTPADFASLVLALPQTVEGTSWGQPSFKTNGKFLTRLRLEAEGSAVIHVGDLDRRDMLLEADPAAFHITDHYRGYPAILARLEAVDPAWLRGALLERWRTLATKAAVHAFDALA
jgi:hypothetical protein